MKVYELASQLGVMSSDLAQVAQAHSLGRLSPADELSPEVEAALRRLFTPPSAPMAWAPDGSGAEPVPSPGIGAPTGPPSMPPPPPGFGSPGSPMPPPPFGASPSDSPWAPSTNPPGGTPPPGAPSFPPPPIEGPPRAQVLGPATIDDPISPRGKGSFATSQLLMVGGAVALAVALFVYMAANTGGDRPAAQEVGPAPTTTAPASVATTDPPVTSITIAAPSTTTTVQEEEAPPTTRIHRHELRDTATFCRGAQQVMPMELRIAAVGLEADWLGLQEAVRADRATWEIGVADLLEGGTEALQDDIALYRDSYTGLFDRILAAPSTTAIIASFEDFDHASLQGAAYNLNWTIQKHCQ